MKILKIVTIYVFACMIGVVLMSIFSCVYHAEETPANDDISKILMYVYTNEFERGHDMPANTRLESIGESVYDEYHNRNVYRYILIEPDIACYYVEAWQEDSKWYGDVIKQL